MANAHTSSAYYIDTGSSGLGDRPVLVRAIFVTNTGGGSSVLLLKCNDSNKTLKLRLEIRSTDELTKFYDLNQSPLRFTNGIYVDTVTNCVATLIVEET